MEISKIAQMVGGRVDGDDGSEIAGLNGLETAKKGDLVFAADDEKLAIAEKTAASCVLTTESVRKSSKPLIRVKNPKLAFLLIYNTMAKGQARKGAIDPKASVSAKARLGKDVWIGPFVSIEDDCTIGDNTIVEANCVIKKNCSVGKNCVIYPNVTLYENCILKNDVIVHAGVVLGADGFGYVREGGRIYKFPQLGRVIIEDGVEVGPNTCIDRGALSNTVIGAGSKIDNLCQIAHNVKIGKNSLIAAQTGFSGSCTVGENLTMAGQVGVADNTVIGRNVIVGAQSGVLGRIHDNEVIWGTPARSMPHVKRQIAVLSWLTKNFKLISKALKIKGEV